MSEENTVPAAPAEDVPTLSLTDIQNVLQIIDYGAQEGVYRGWAMIEQVLVQRNRLTAFLNAATTAQAAAAEAAPETGASEG